MSASARKICWALNVGSRRSVRLFQPFEDAQPLDAHSIHRLDAQLIGSGDYNVTHFGKATEPLGHPTAGGGHTLFLKLAANEFLQFVQWQRAGDFPRGCADAHQQWLFLVELILDLADQLYERILEGDHAHGAA